MLKMNESAQAEIDEIDVKILHALIRDARARLKDIAKDCGVSSVAILNRIKRLKASGVITGATMFPNLAKFGGVIMATLGINLETGKEEVSKMMAKKYLSPKNLAITTNNYGLTSDC
jgi:Lrp/AsnC family transcriptional regulator for asnA, asnC and gidA